MKKRIIFVVSMVLLTLIAQCKKERLIGDCVERDCFICTFYDQPSFYISSDMSNPYLKDGGYLTIRFSIDDNHPGYNYFRYKYAKEHQRYSERYNDFNYKGCSPNPNDFETLAEPLSNIHCYSINNEGKKEDVSCKVIFKGSSFLPYIESRYDKRVLEGGDEFEGTLILKPLTEVTKRDLTLINVSDNEKVFSLIAIKPYRFEGKIQIEFEMEGCDPIILSTTVANK